MMEKRSLPEPNLNCWKSSFRPESNIGATLDDRIKLTALIGSGACGAVYSAVNLESRERVAVKVLPKLSNPRLYKASDDTLSPPSPTPKRRKKESSEPWPISFEQATRFHVDNPQCRAYREAAIHLSLHEHPYIVSLHEILDSQDLLWLVLDYYPSGDLFHAVTDLGWYTQEEDDRIKLIFNQILDAVEYCHYLNIYHCDLKPENILVSDSGDHVCLADFGLATKHAISRDHGCGSSFYMSPERVEVSLRVGRTGFSTKASDIWALGVILLNLVCGRNPWRKASLQDASYVKFRREADFLPRILPISRELNNVMRRIFYTKPSKCISLEELRALVNACPVLRPSKSKDSTTLSSASSSSSSSSYLFSSMAAKRHPSLFASHCRLAHRVAKNSLQAQGNAGSQPLAKKVAPLTPISSPQINGSVSPSALAVEIALSPGTQYPTEFSSEPVTWSDPPYLNTPPTEFTT